MKFKITEETRKVMPYTCKYVELYGEKQSDDSYEIILASTFETLPRHNRKPELLYKECIESGKKWTDLVKTPKNVIL